jgi:hypothetical protein
MRNNSPKNAIKMNPRWAFGKRYGLNESSAAHPRRRKWIYRIACVVERDLGRA